MILNQVTLEHRRVKCALCKFVRKFMVGDAIPGFLDTGHELVRKALSRWLASGRDDSFFRRCERDEEQHCCLDQQSSVATHHASRHTRRALRSNYSGASRSRC